MGKFRIMPHGRLQEWVAEEHGYFTTEGRVPQQRHLYSSCAAVGLPGFLVTYLVHERPGVGRDAWYPLLA
jgi:hypothetical protein